MNIITLTSDYGLKDPYAGIWKGSIFRLNAMANVVDISHNIAPANFSEAAYVLGSAYAYFPKGTVHVIAIEEMDAQSMRFLALQKDGHYFVAPDNGILSLIRPEYTTESVHIIDIEPKESEFPATEIMTKAALFLADGGTINVLGKACTDMKTISPWKPLYNEQNKLLTAHVVYVDRRGNLVTNLNRKTFHQHLGNHSFIIHLPAGTRISRITNSFREIRQEAVIFALFNHNELLEIGVNGGSFKASTGASHLLGLSLQDKITIEFT
jgi:S-adenosyl-L-methionine hydrolase (adenosine-forming)